MRELLDPLIAVAQSGRRIACCRLVETRGSTPQKPGAAMLVFDDGSQAGTLGGGCVEADVKRQALAILAEGHASVVRFQLDDDYGWDDGLICGGRMQVLIDPVARPAALDYYSKLRALSGQGAGLTEAIVFDAQASGLPESASYLFDAEGRIIDHVRGPLEDGLAPRAIREGLQPLADRPRPSARHGVAYLPMLPRCRLVIVGGGHVGQAVGNLAAELDFDVWVVDDRQEYVTEARFPLAERRIAGAMTEVLRDLEITPSTYCLIVTRGHNHDEEALYHLVDRGARYVGMIGSKRKIKLIFDDLAAGGISPEALDRVYAPVGLDIGSQTVMEIAISITAELVAHRNLGSAPEIARERPSLAGDPD
ncbi:MAG TPA: XdhC family protein [Pirellulales bacterium]|jgi:xanthine dehydrogenase accessory factor|nr:XdhC family protein [Pirellulales bacterium]